ncbi:MAG: TRAP transporter substrate-binding protein [Dehalococcoidia bacterium]|nr:TRAP transporter substrate-binding protein [Dehalococcoidia bacterium]
MKKSIFVTILVAVLAISFMMPSCTSSPAPDAASQTRSTSPAEDNKVYEFSYSVFFPPTHLNAVLAQQYCDEINARTNGKVKITVFSGGTLTPAPQVYDGVVNGLSDMGMSVLAYTMGRFPACEMIDLPHGYANGFVATKVANDFYNEFKPAEFDQVHVLYFHAHGPSVILSTKKPVKQIEDLKGMVIRSTGVGAKIIEALGGKGYGAAQGEAYELMSKGTIDGSYTPRETLKGWKQAEVIKYVTECVDVGSTADMFVVINKSKWDSLPADLQKIFTDVSNEWIEKHGKVWTYYDKVAIDYFNTFEGREVIKLSSKESAKWMSAATPLKDTYISERMAKGVPAESYEKYLNERAKYWAANSPSEQACAEYVNSELVK